MFGVPALADRIAPLIPLSVEQRLGAAIDTQVRAHARYRQVRASRSNAARPTPRRAGRAALDKLVGRLESGGRAADPAARPRWSAAREANAIALPGGHIYVFEGLIAQGAQRPTSSPASIAHEIGHVAHRDGTRSLLQAAGLSFLFGMLLGDFTGGGLVVIAAKTVLQSAYSREVEAAADRLRRRA